MVGQAAARQLHLPLGSGDLLVHDHNVLHGVNVTSGTRYSLVGWYKDRPGLCASDDNPWVLEMAEAGDAEAMYNVMQRAQATGDQGKADKWGKRAANAGHAGAMTAIAAGLFRTNQEDDRKEATRLLAKASELGRRDAMAFYAWALDRGAGLPHADPEAALMWRRRAAALGHAQARRELEAAGLSVEG